MRAFIGDVHQLHSTLLQTKNVHVEKRRGARASTIPPPPFIAHKRLKNLCTVVIRDHENALKRFKESGYLPDFNLKTSHFTKLLQREKPADFFFFVYNYFDVFVDIYLSRISHMLRKRLNHLEPRTIRGGSAFLPGLRS